MAHRGGLRIVITAMEEIDQLRVGFRRFLTGRRQLLERSSQERRAEVAGGQEPFAVVIGCADSRVPVEVVFDAGLGELFVVRVAGNVVESSQVGSVEYAVEHLGTSLVVVLGHTSCGAVSAALGAVRQPGAVELRPGVAHLVQLVRGPVEKVLESADGLDEAEVLRRAVRANVFESVDALVRSSELLRRKQAAGELVLVGAEYSLDSGEVEFLSAGS